MSPNPEKEGLDFLLILSPPWGFATPPLGCAYVLESVERAGLSAKFIDLNSLLLKDVQAQPDILARLTELFGISDPNRLWTYSALPIWHHGETFELFNVLFPLIIDHLSPHFATPPKVVGLSVYKDNLYFSGQVARAIHASYPNVPIIFGGPWLKNYYHKEAIWPDSADLLIFGEAEEILPKVLKEILSERTPNRRALLKDRYNFELTAYPVDVHKIPYPTYKSFDLELYQPRHACAITARGCPKRCAFCVDWVLMRKYRERDVESVLAELEFLTKELGMKFISFNDLNIGINVERLKAVANGIMERGLDIAWDANLSVSEALDEGVFALLAKSGARTLQFGIESASPKILKLMGKDYSPDAAKKVLKSAHEAGLKPIVNFIVGYPDETEDDFNLTAAFLTEVAEYLDQIGTISTLHIVPLTCLAKDTSKLGIEPIEGEKPFEHNWQQKDLDLKTRLARTYKLIALSKKLNLKMIHTNAEIDRIELKRYKANLRPGTMQRGGISNHKVLKRGEGSLAVELSKRLIHVQWQNQQITSIPHLYFDFDSPDGKRFFSIRALWSYEENAQEDVLTATATWELINLRLRCELFISKDRLSWTIIAESEKPMTLKRFKIGIALSEKYNVVGTESEVFKLEGNNLKKWIVLGPHDKNGRLPLSPDFDGSCEFLYAEPKTDVLPRVDVRSINPLVSLPVIQSGCAVGPSLGFYRYKLEIPKGNIKIAELNIDLKEVNPPQK